MSRDKGLVHLYYGDGKGKTTAGMGLAIRAVGHGRKVLILQFLKSGKSGEIEVLRSLGAVVLAGKLGHAFVKDMTEDDKEANRISNDRMLEEALRSDADVIMMDELCAAVEYGLVDEDLAKKTVFDRPEGREIIITGRHPASWMKDAADYITNMVAERHPADKGIMAREGIEY